MNLHLTGHFKIFVSLCVFPLFPLANDLNGHFVRAHDRQV
jgi:hypothetical protein